MQRWKIKSCCYGVLDLALRGDFSRVDFVLLMCTWSRCLVGKMCLTPCNPRGYSSPGSVVHGNFQEKAPEWFAISSSRGSSWPTDQTHIHISCRRILYHCDTGYAQKGELKWDFGHLFSALLSVTFHLEDWNQPW